MNAGLKLGGYGLVLAALLGGGAALGAAVGPIDTDGATSHDSTEEDTMKTALPAAGLLVSQDGYTFQTNDRTDDDREFSFTIVGPDGDPVTRYDLLHDRELHLVVASRDLRHYAHVHPQRDPDGVWRADLPALPPGAYRAFADFHPTGGSQLTLGIDVVVPGPVERLAPLAPVSATTVDGYDVTLDHDDHGTMTVTVRRGGAVVTTEPYLGAAGHLVALRDGDLAYLHVHPLDEAPSGPVRFAVEVPSAGTYALFFDFQIGGQVRTARFVVDVVTVPSSGGHGGGH